MNNKSQQLDSLFSGVPAVRESDANVTGGHSDQEPVFTPKLDLVVEDQDERNANAVSFYNKFKSSYVRKPLVASDVLIYEDLLCHLHTILARIEDTRHKAPLARAAVFYCQASLETINILNSLLVMYQETQSNTTNEVEKNKLTHKFLQVFVTKKMSELLKPKLCECDFNVKDIIFGNLEYDEVESGVDPLVCLEALKTQFQKLALDLADISNQVYIHKEEIFFRVSAEEDTLFTFQNNSEVRKSIDLLASCLHKGNQLFKFLNECEFDGMTSEKCFELLDKKELNFLYPRILPCIVFIREELVDDGILHTALYSQTLDEGLRDKLTPHNFLSKFELAVLCKRAGIVIPVTRLF